MRVCHYYSPMKFKVVLPLLLILAISACTHNKNTPPRPADPVASRGEGIGDNERDNSGAPADQNDPKSTEAEDVEPTLTPTLEPILEPTLEPETVSDIEVDNIQIPSNTLKPSDADILDRIRRGFSFPELTTKDVTQHERWASEHSTYLTNLFGRAEPFLFFIVEEIEKRGLPMELALLPAVESAFDPGAVSRSRAAGLWQFVPATGRGFGLRQDWWYDGRHDPYSSTFAALDYLEQLHNMFDGDWFIALAAYNAGPGTLRREIRKAKRRGRKTDYVSLNLRQETRRYIPKLVALKQIIQDPQKYNLTLPVVANRPYFEVVELPGQIDLVEFAKNSKIDRQLLRHLNRGFKRWATSPDGPHRLLVPLNSDNDVDYAKLAIENTPKVNYRNHRITNGDTLSGIARTYGVSVAALRNANKLRNTKIRAGKSLLIPVRSPVAATQPIKTATTNGQESKVTHRVKRGDTLWSIARHYQVKLDQLMNWNNLRSNDILNLNQVLTVFVN